MIKDRSIYWGGRKGGFVGNWWMEIGEVWKKELDGVEGRKRKREDGWKAERVGKSWRKIARDCRKGLKNQFGRWVGKSGRL